MRGKSAGGNAVSLLLGGGRNSLLQVLRLHRPAPPSTAYTLIFIARKCQQHLQHTAIGENGACAQAAAGSSLQKLMAEQAKFNRPRLRMLESLPAVAHQSLVSYWQAEQAEDARRAAAGALALVAAALGQAVDGLAAWRRWRGAEAATWRRMRAADPAVPVCHRARSHPTTLCISTVHIAGIRNYNLALMFLRNLCSSCVSNTHGKRVRLVYSNNNSAPDVVLLPTDPDGGARGGGDAAPGGLPRPAAPRLRPGRHPAHPRAGAGARAKQTEEIAEAEGRLSQEEV